MNDWDEERVDIVGQNGNDGLHYDDEALISNVEVKDNPDGSANVTMDIDPEAQSLLIKQGLQYLIEEMKLNDKVVVLAPNEFSGKAKTWELSDNDANALLHFGFIQAIKLGMSDGD